MTHTSRHFVCLTQTLTHKVSIGMRLGLYIPGNSRTVTFFLKNYVVTFDLRHNVHEYFTPANLCTVLQVKAVDLKPGVYRCHLSLPTGLVIKTSSIPKAGAGVWAEAPVPKGVRFGPYEGIIVEHSEDAHSGYCWQVILLECRSKEALVISGHNILLITDVKKLFYATLVFTITFLNILPNRSCH